jgi:hypothetical protein
MVGFSIDVAPTALGHLTWRGGAKLRPGWRRMSACQSFMLLSDQLFKKNLVEIVGTLSKKLTV